MIKALLYKLGLNDKEVQVYQMTLKHAKISPALLAKHTKLPRPTVYNICKNLVAKGLLIEDLGDKTLQVLPTPASELKSLIKREEEEYKIKTRTIEDLSNELSLLKSETLYPVPKIRFIEEKSLEEYLYNRTPLWNKSIMASDGIWWGFQDHSFTEKYQTWIDWFWKVTPKDLKLKLLSNRSKLENDLKGKYERRDIKPWNKSENYTATTWVLGDYLVMIVTDSEPYYLVEIHDARMAHNFRETFRNLWDLVK